MNHRAVLLAVVLALPCGSLAGQVPAEERTPVTDPDRLQTMGFRRDATNVYVWSKADRKGGRVEDAGTLRAKEAETWGTQTGFTSLSPTRLEVAWSDDIHLYKDLGSASCLDNSSFGDVLAAWAGAQIEVPDGARLDQFLFWAYDVQPDRDLTVEIWETCQLEGAHPPTFTLIAESQTFLAIGEYFGFASLNDLTVDNKHCTYSVGVLFSPSGQECVDLAFRKLRVNWIRQVSPAPSTATFGDVPTSHPFFQFVEALVKSGVTGGCSASPPLYCPDTPVTRGQMAVFLAKALGLQWP